MSMKNHTPEQLAVALQDVEAIRPDDPDRLQFRQTIRQEELPGPSLEHTRLSAGRKRFGRRTSV